MRRILCEQCVIRGRSVVQDIPVAELDAFRTYAMSSLYRRRQVVFHEGTQATGLYILCHGAVKLYQSDRFGRDHILGVLGAGAVLGEMPIGPDVCYAASAEALTDAQLCYLPRDGLTQLIHRYPAFGVRIIEALSTELSNARRRVRGLALKSAESRLAEWVLDMVEHTGEPTPNGAMRVPLEYSRREIAEMIGVSTETAIRLLGRLKQRQAITTSQGELVVTDSTKLRRLATQDSIDAA